MTRTHLSRVSLLCRCSRPWLAYTRETFRQEIEVYRSSHFDASTLTEKGKVFSPVITAALSQQQVHQPRADQKDLGVMIGDLVSMLREEAKSQSGDSDDDNPDIQVSRTDHLPT